VVGAGISNGNHKLTVMKSLQNLRYLSQFLHTSRLKKGGGTHNTKKDTEICKPQL